MPNDGALANSDELYHWKYARRKRVNGKWRYYYDRAKPKISNKAAKKKQESDSKGNDSKTTNNSLLSFLQENSKLLTRSVDELMKNADVRSMDDQEMKNFFEKYGRMKVDYEHMKIEGIDKIEADAYNIYYKRAK